MSFDYILLFVVSLIIFGGSYLLLQAAKDYRARMDMAKRKQ